MTGSRGEIPEFLVGGRYANRKGEYEVLRIQGNKMWVRYDDGTEQELTVEIQARIAVNMALEVEQLVPYKSSKAQERFYFSLGFLAARATKLEAFVPSHALKGFDSSYGLIKGQGPAFEQEGLYVHEPKVDKWGCELRVTFRATPEEIDSLDFGPDVDVVEEPSKPGVLWRINNNGFWWRLLKFGFDVGSQQNVDIVKARIPIKYREIFSQGYKEAL